jgi:sirohydrochlorin ferrochelatase
MPTLPKHTGVIIIDHGSRREAANEMLFDVITQYRETAGAEIVEGAHMELAKPTLEDAVEACISQGACCIVVHPYFLAPGRHSTGDIPAMVADLAKIYSKIRFCVTKPLGIAPQLAEVIQQRVLESVD